MKDRAHAPLAYRDTGALSPASLRAPGTSAPFVFLHGAAWAAVSWQRHIDELAPTHRCIAVDLPGHGGSHEMRWTTLDDVADAVAATIHEAISEDMVAPAHLVGFSLGGDVGIRLLARHPSIVRSALFTGVSTFSVPRWELAADALTWPLVALPGADRIAAHAMRLAPKLRADHLASSSRLRVRDYARLSWQVLSGTSLTGLVNVRTPVLALAGERESAHAKRSAVQLAHAVPGGRAAFVPDGRHTWHVASPTLFVEVLTAWAESPGTVHSALHRTPPERST